MKILFTIIVFLGSLTLYAQNTAPTLSAGLDQLTYKTGTLDVELIAEIIKEKQEELVREGVKKLIFKTIGDANLDDYSQFYVERVTEILFQEKNHKVMTKRILEESTNYLFVLGTTKLILDSKNEEISNLFIENGYSKEKPLPKNLSNFKDAELRNKVIKTVLTICSEIPEIKELGLLNNFNYYEHFKIYDQSFAKDIIADYGQVKDVFTVDNMSEIFNDKTVKEHLVKIKLEMFENLDSKNKSKKDPKVELKKDININKFINENQNEFDAILEKIKANSSVNFTPTTTYIIEKFIFYFIKGNKDKINGNEIFNVMEQYVKSFDLITEIIVTIQKLLKESAVIKDVVTHYENIANNEFVKKTGEDESIDKIIKNYKNLTTNSYKPKDLIFTIKDDEVYNSLKKQKDEYENFMRYVENYKNDIENIVEKIENKASFLKDDAIFDNIKSIKDKIKELDTISDSIEGFRIENNQNVKDINSKIQKLKGISVSFESSINENIQGLNKISDSINPANEIKKIDSSFVEIKHSLKKTRQTLNKQITNDGHYKKLESLLVLFDKSTPKISYDSLNFSKTLDVNYEKYDNYKAIVRVFNEEKENIKKFNKQLSHVSEITTTVNQIQLASEKLKDSIESGNSIEFSVKEKDLLGQDTCTLKNKGFKKYISKKINNLNKKLDSILEKEITNNTNKLNEQLGKYIVQSFMNGDGKTKTNEINVAQKLFYEIRSYITKNLVLKQDAKLTESEQATLKRLYSFFLDRNMHDNLDNLKVLELLNSNFLAELALLSNKFTERKKDNHEVNPVIKLINSIEFSTSVIISSSINKERDIFNDFPNIDLITGYLKFIGNIKELNKAETFAYLIKTMNDYEYLFANADRDKLIPDLVNSLRQYAIIDLENDLIEIDVASVLTHIVEQHYNGKRGNFSFYATVGVNQFWLTEGLPMSNDETLTSFNAASEKIGVKFKIKDYTQQNLYDEKLFHNVKNKPFVSDIYAMAYASGILYKLADTAGNNYDAANAGIAIGLSFFNSLDFNVSYALPFEGSVFKNGIIGFSFDIPLSEYLKRL